VINSLSPERKACKWIVGVLRIAKDYNCEERLGNGLLACVDNNRPLPSLKALQERYLGHKPVPSIPERQQDLTGYDCHGFLIKTLLA